MKILVQEQITCRRLAAALYYTMNADLILLCRFSVAIIFCYDLCISIKFNKREL